MQVLLCILKIVRTHFSPPVAAVAKTLKNLPENLNRNYELDNFKFFFGGVRITEILSNFNLGGKFFKK